MCDGALHRPEGLGVPGQFDIQGVATLLAGRKGVTSLQVNDLVVGGDTEVRRPQSEVSKQVVSCMQQ